MNNFRLLGSSDLGTICATINDYHSDYKHLRPHIRFVLLSDILYKVVSEFLIAIESRFVKLLVFRLICCF
jgi:hypothetical protein